MDKLSNRLRLSRSQSVGVGGGLGGGDKIGMAAAAARRNVQQQQQTGASDKMSGGGGGGSSETSEVTAGRPASVILLDERRLELHIQPRMYAGELLDLVASHCQLREKEFFGLAVVDENGHYQWLQLDRKVLDHDLPRKPMTLTVHFLVKFFIESISHLSENRTVELFYLQARSLIFRGTLEVDSDIVFQLAALALQASFGDYVDDATTRNLVKKSPILPASVLKEHPSLTFCEDKVIEIYRKTKGQTRGQSVVNYMTIVESMPTYGVHYFEVYDKRQAPWWLGLSCRGIAQYGYTDRKVPVRVFQWKQLENLYFRDKKFSIEVHDAKRVVQTVSTFNLYEDALKLDKHSDTSEASTLKETSGTAAGEASGSGVGGGASGAAPGDKKDELVDAIADSTTQVSVSRRSFNPGAIHVYVWFGKTQSLTKCIWQSAISQHQFYLDRKQAKMRHVPVRTLKEIARDLTRSTASLSSASSMSNLSRSGSTHSLAVSTTLSIGTAGGGADETDQSEETKRARMEMLAALKARREALVAKLDEKNRLLKELCIKEGELTGELPPEIPLAPGEPVPAIRRRVGTEFALPETLLTKPSAKSAEEEMIARLELEYEIQSKITSAALKIANDSHAAKSVRKQRKVSYQQSQRKLREIEAKLNSLKHSRQLARRGGGAGGGGPGEPRPKRGMSVPDLDLTLDDSQTASEAKVVMQAGAGAAERVTPKLNLLMRDQVDSASAAGATSCPSSPRKSSSTAAAVGAGHNLHQKHVLHGPSTKAKLVPKPDSVSLEASPQRVARSSGYVPSSVYLRSSYRTTKQQQHQFNSALSAAAGGAGGPAGVGGHGGGGAVGHHGDVGLPLSPDVMAAAANRSATLPSPYRNKYEVPNIQIDSPVGLYNCPQQRTSQAFSSMDDLDAMAAASSTGGSAGSATHFSYQQAAAAAAAAAVRSPQHHHSPHRLTPTRSNFVNQHLLSHQGVLSQAQAIISRAEAATAAALNTQQQKFPSAAAAAAATGSLERSTSNVSSVVHAKRELPLLPSDALGADPTAEEMLRRKLSHHRGGQQTSSGLSLADGLSTSTTHLRPVLPNTEEYPPHHHPSYPRAVRQAGGGLGPALPHEAASAGASGFVTGARPFPTAALTSNHSTGTLLPGQTYPDHSVVAAPKYPGIHTLQEVFYHREMRLAAASSTSSQSHGGHSTSSLKDAAAAGAGSKPPPPPPKKTAAASAATPASSAAPGTGDSSPPPPPLYPKQYHQVVEQRRRSGLDRPTATAVPPPSSSHSPVVDRKIKPPGGSGGSSQETAPPSSATTSSSSNLLSANAAPPPGNTHTYRETSKPFEMSDFYKYSTKFRKTSQSSTVSLNADVNGNADSDSSPRSSTASGSSNGGSGGSGVLPPEVPARPFVAPGSSPSKAPPPPPPKSEKLSSSSSNTSSVNLTNNNTGNNNNVHHSQQQQPSKDSLADSFSSELLDWYNKKSITSNSAAISSTVDNKTNSGDSSKPATLV